MYVTFQLTRKDIDSGCETAQLHLNCPWARAINRRLKKGFYASVGTSSFSIEKVKEKSDDDFDLMVFHARLPEKVSKWIRQHDDVLGDINEKEKLTKLPCIQMSVNIPVDVCSTALLR